MVDGTCRLGRRLPLQALIMLTTGILVLVAYSLGAAQVLLVQHILRK